MPICHLHVCVAACVLLLLFAPPLHTTPTPAELLIGAWEWVSSQDAWTGATSTPVTAGYTMQLQFFANRTVLGFTDGQLDWSSTWEFRTNGLDPYVFLWIGGAGYVCEVTETSLRLDSRFVDGPLMIFTRRQPVPLDRSSWSDIKARFGETNTANGHR